MTESEAKTILETEIVHHPECLIFAEAIDIAIQALKTIKKLTDRKMTTEVLENYMQFEDECVKKGFTFKSVIEAREKQIAKKPIRHTAWENFKCPACGSAEIVQYDTEYREYDKDCKFEYCSDCGQKIDWSDEG